MHTDTILEVFMKDKVTQQRILAVQRFGEKPESICALLGRSRAWLYKCVERHIEDDDSWNEAKSKRPLSITNRTPKEIEVSPHAYFLAQICVRNQTCKAPPAKLRVSY